MRPHSVIREAARSRPPRVKMTMSLTIEAERSRKALLQPSQSLTCTLSAAEEFVTTTLTDGTRLFAAGIPDAFIHPAISHHLAIRIPEQDPRPHAGSSLGLENRWASPPSSRWLRDAPRGGPWSALGLPPIRVTDGGGRAEITLRVWTAGGWAA